MPKQKVFEGILDVKFIIGGVLTDIVFEAIEVHPFDEVPTTE